MAMIPCWAVRLRSCTNRWRPAVKALESATPELGHACRGGRADARPGHAARRRESARQRAWRHAHEAGRYGGWRVRDAARAAARRYRRDRLDDLRTTRVRG